MPTFDLWARVNPDLVDTLPFDPYLASAALPGSPPPVSPPKEADTLLTLPTLVLGETVDDDLDGSAIADPKDTKVECLPPVADPQASVPEVPGQPDVAAEPSKSSKAKAAPKVPVPKLAELELWPEQQWPTVRPT